MANQEHLDILKQGVDVWNEWRREYPDIGIDLVEVNLREGAELHHLEMREEAHILLQDNLREETHLVGVNLSEANLRGANLSRYNLSQADLSEANLRGANLSRVHLYGATLTDANLSKANLSGANLRGANLSGANLSEAELTDANLRGANLSRANLNRATLIRTNLTRATLTGCSIYGISVWNVDLEGAKQDSLVVTPKEEPTITVDNLKLAQFIYLLLNNQEIREVINTLTTKAVLILGRFTSERKAVLDAVREALRAHGYVPILFDFDKPASRDITETVSTLAHLARFVIADITDAKSIPQELQRIVPDLPSVPVQLLILSSQHEYSMFEHFIRYPWVLPIYRYTDQASLLQSLKENVIDPAEQKVQALANR